MTYMNISTDITMTYMNVFTNTTLCISYIDLLYITMLHIPIGYILYILYIYPIDIYIFISCLYSSTAVNTVLLTVISVTFVISVTLSCHYRYSTNYDTTPETELSDCRNTIASVSTILSLNNSLLETKFYYLQNLD